MALVVVLAKLHNFCINETDESTIPSMTAADDLNLSLGGGIPLERDEAAQMHLPRQLMGGGDHFDDMDRRTRHARECEAAWNHDELLPRERLCMQVQDGNLSRPPPDSRRHWYIYCILSLYRFIKCINRMCVMTTRQSTSITAKHWVEYDYCDMALLVSSRLLQFHHQYP